MNIRNLVDKIEFSHIVCFSLGVLTAIYSDVLFLHEFNSSTVSAIMDTVVAGSAIYAALSVRNWLKDRVKNKGFEHAEKILMNMTQSFIKLQSLKSGYDNFCDEYSQCKELSSSDNSKMKKIASELLDLSRSLNIELAQLLVEIKTLRSWDMNCKAENEYINFITAADNTRDCIQDFIKSAINMTYFNRYFYWQRNKEQIQINYKSTIDNYNNLEIRFEDVFCYERK